MEDSSGFEKIETVTFKDGLRLESGRLLAPITIAYESYGRLNTEKSNAVLVTHAWTGDGHAAGRYSAEDRKPGWWDDMIGPGKPLDTNRYFVLCSNVLGSCKGSTGPASMDPQTKRRYNLSFPVILVQDMVHAQKLLLDYLEIPTLVTVIGGSMGAMQALEWSILYPDVPRSIIPIAGTACTPPMAIALNGLARQAVFNDPAWKNGNYRPEAPPVEGLALARSVGHISFLSSASMEIKFGRRYSVKDGLFDFFGKFEVERYLDYNGSNFVKRFDTNAFLYLARALDLFDAAWNFDSLEEAFSRITCPSLWFAFSSDWLYPPEQTEEAVAILRKLGKPAEYHLIESEYGHDSFLVEPEKFIPMLCRFLDRFEPRRKKGA